MRLRAIVASCAFLFVVSPALADPRDDALNAISQCANLTDDHARLACYDAAQAQVKQALAAPPAPPAQVAVAQPPAPPQSGESWFGLPDIFGGDGRPPQTTPQQFGNDDLPPPPPGPPAPGQPAAPPVVDSITEAVADYAFNPFGHFTVFLTNGQIWQQLEGDVDQAHFSKSGPNKVTIERQALGSYGLVINDQAKSFKVKRLK